MSIQMRKLATGEGRGREDEENAIFLELGEVSFMSGIGGQAGKQ
jgi:hypothetical protein